MDPTNVGSLVMRVVKLNDQGHSLVKDRIRRQEAMEEREEEKIQNANSENNKYMLKQAFDTVATQRTMTGHGANDCIKHDYIRANEELGVGFATEDD